ncbi:MAG: NAD(P)H-hydrate dehydratase [Bacteroidia bacterium]|nr:NAD(P)H-hydrate dehydratase [Bacteroidia bacterium]
MKILSASQIREADAYTIAHEPVSPDALMERAAGKCFEWIVRHFSSVRKFTVYCGPGNNGGDGKVLIHMLKEAGREVGENGEVIIDALFGTGLSRPPEGKWAEQIEAINKSKKPVIAIDIPSGLFADDNGAGDPEHIVWATHTLTFQCPKLSMMLPFTGKYCGKIHVIDIGLHQRFIDTVRTKYYYTDERSVKEIYKPREKFSHKGTYGHALIAAGKEGMMGAAILAGRACLHSGTGLLTMRIPGGEKVVIQTALPEAIVDADTGVTCLSGRIRFVNETAVGAGPGIGTGEDTNSFIKLLIQECPVPLLLDADALNILSANPTWLAFIPAGTILTPHPGEFARLFGAEPDDLKRLDQLIRQAVRLRSVIVLKGAHTWIGLPDGTVWFNATGNPGLAKGGSGDVLSGIITSLLAQGYPPSHAAIFGVYLHGLAADIAVNASSEEALIPGDVISHLGDAFKALA